MKQSIFFKTQKKFYKYLYSVPLLFLLACSAKTIHFANNGKANDINKKLNGEQIIYSENGNILEKRYWDHGIPVDSVMCYDSNGDLKEKGYFEDSYLKLYDLKGNLLVECKFNGNKVDGMLISYHKNGNLRSIIEYRNGIKDGIELHFYEDGSIYTQVFHKRGKSNGIFLAYYPNHRLRHHATFKDGELNGLMITYDEFGEKIREKYIIPPQKKTLKEFHYISPDSTGTGIQDIIIFNPLAE